MAETARKIQKWTDRWRDPRELSPAQRYHRRGHHVLRSAQPWRRAKGWTRRPGYGRRHVPGVKPGVIRHPGYRATRVHSGTRKHACKKRNREKGGKGYACVYMISNNHAKLSQCEERFGYKDIGDATPASANRAKLPMMGKHGHAYHYILYAENITPCNGLNIYMIIR